MFFWLHFRFVWLGFFFFISHNINWRITWFREQPQRTNLKSRPQDQHHEAHHCRSSLPALSWLCILGPRGLSPPLGCLADTSCSRVVWQGAWEGSTHPLCGRRLVLVVYYAYKQFLYPDTTVMLLETGILLCRLGR